MAWSGLRVTVPLRVRAAFMPVAEASGDHTTLENVVAPVPNPIAPLSDVLPAPLTDTPAPSVLEVRARVAPLASDTVAPALSELELSNNVALLATRIDPSLVRMVPRNCSEPAATERVP